MFHLKKDHCIEKNQPLYCSKTALQETGTLNNGKQRIFFMEVEGYKAGNPKNLLY